MKPILKMTLNRKAVLASAKLTVILFLGACSSTNLKIPGDAYLVPQHLVVLKSQPNFQGGIQTSCDFCLTKYGIDIISAPCPPIKPEPQIETPQGSGSSLVDWEISRFTWGIGADLAHATLTPWDSILNIRVNGDLGWQEVNIPLDSIDGDSVIPVSIKLVSPTSMLVGMHVQGATTGKILLVNFDNDSIGVPYVFTTLYSGAGFSWPSSIYVRKAEPNIVLVFDELSHSVSVVNTITDVVTLIADPSLAPSLLERRYLYGGPTTYMASGSSNPTPARHIMCTDEKVVSPFSAITRLVDIDDDWVVDYIDVIP